MALVAITAFSAPALAHYAGFTGSDTYDIYIPTGQHKFIGGSSPVNHSYSFISADDLAGRVAYLCANIYRASNHGYFEGHCNWGFVRHCYSASTHNAYNMLDCHDQDYDTQLHAGANNDSAGTTVRLHGTY